MTNDETQYDDMPEALRDALRKLQPTAPDITARSDREIAALAATHFAVRAQKRRVLRPAWAAAAAVGIIAIGLTVNLQSPAPQQLYSDVDNSGQIDIADVFALARNSGAYTQEQLDAFALSVVALDDNGDAS